MRLAVIAAVILSFSVVGCTRAQEDKAFGEKVRAYLLAHPEVLEEAMEKLQENQAVAERVKIERAIPANRAAIEHDAGDFVANPNGRITVTEFYDYRCPHCINVAPAVLDLIAKNPDVRFVFKELPIFGPVSEHAARGALLARNQGKDYVAIHHDFMTARPLDVAATDRILRAHGVDPVAADTGPGRTETDAHVNAVRVLAGKLNIQGTPTFIVGDRVVIGEDADGLRQAIADARKAAH